MITRGEQAHDSVAPNRLPKKYLPKRYIILTFQNVASPTYKSFRPFGRGPTTPGIGDLRSP